MEQGQAAVEPAEPEQVVCMAQVVLLEPVPIVEERELPVFPARAAVEDHLEVLVQMGRLVLRQLAAPLLPEVVMEEMEELLLFRTQ